MTDTLIGTTARIAADPRALPRVAADACWMPSPRWPEVMPSGGPAVQAACRKGYAYAFEETLPGVHTMSVPVYDAYGALAAASVVTAPAMRLPRSWMDELLPWVQATAGSVSTELGYRSDDDGDVLDLDAAT